MRAGRGGVAIFLSLAACAGGQKAALTGSSRRALAATEEVSSAALQADVPKALELLGAVPAGEFQGAEASWRECMLDRFGRGQPPPAVRISGDASLPDQLLAAYRGYWWRTLTHQGSREAEEERLYASLHSLLGEGSGKNLDELEAAISGRMQRASLHVLLGLTAPMRELMIWSQEDVQRQVVALPDGDYPVRVVVLQGFRSLGWGDWATCGRHGAGGWAAGGSLYLVRPRYRTLEDEKYRVSFLGHETQHLSDQRSVPGLAPWQLEYRAKLTELALARETRGDLLESFARNQGEDPAVPHSFADRRVLADLRSRLGLAENVNLASVPGAELSAAARAVLLANTRSARTAH